MSEQKGHLILLQAAKRLKVLGKDFELILVGDGEMRAKIESQIETAGLQGLVTIHGWLDGQKVREAISGARALVLPSFAEGLPVVIMEAMALRRPVISTFVAGIPELVRSGEDGWLVPAGDIDALVTALTACLDATPETLTRMGLAAQSRVNGTSQRYRAGDKTCKVVAGSGHSLGLPNIPKAAYKSNRCNLCTLRSKARNTKALRLQQNSSRWMDYVRLQF